MLPRTLVRLATAVTAAAVLPFAAGCAAPGDPRLRPTSIESPTTPSGEDGGDAATAVTPPEEPQRQATAPRADEPAPDRSSGHRATLAVRLLAASEMPALPAAPVWTEARTSHREPEALAGTCHRYDVVTLGATKVAYREFVPAAGTASAHHLVAQFADAKTAWRAFEVLKSWRDECLERVAKHDRHEVGELTPVDAGGADAHYYLLRYGPAERRSKAEYVDGEGLALVGTRVAVVRMALVGRGDEVDQVAAPIDAAIRAAVAKLP